MGEEERDNCLFCNEIGVPLHHTMNDGSRLPNASLGIPVFLTGNCPNCGLYRINMALMHRTNNMEDLTRNQRIAIGTYLHNNRENNHAILLLDENRNGSVEIIPGVFALTVNAN